MENTNYITTDEACTLLKVSKPTFNRIRVDAKIKSFHSQRRRLVFDRAELIQKVIAQQPTVLVPVDLTIANPNGHISQISIDESIFDFRAINNIDPYGVLSILATIKQLATLKKAVNLVVDKSTITEYLIGIGLFQELERSLGKFVFWDKKITSQVQIKLPEVLYPLKLIGYKGQDKSAAEELLVALRAQGFSDNIANYIAWILGELADNSLTHSESLCYILAARYPGQKNLLEIGILDSGIGIQNSLRKNEKYKNLDNKTALLSAFRSHVSSWPDDAGRGKGLTDVVNIALGNRSFFKVDSCGESIYWDFLDLRKNVNFMNPMTDASGVRFCFVLVDSDFEIKDRSEIDQIINERLQKPL